MVILYKVLPKFTHGWAFQFSKENLEVLESILNKRTGKDTLQKTRFGFYDAKVRVRNHGFATNNLKHSMSCSRNGINRDHSAIHLINNEFWDSILLKTRTCGVPLSPNSPSLNILHRMSQQQMYHCHWSRSTRVCNIRVTLQRMRFADYTEANLKGQLEPK